jgi:hypothetical protein
MTVCIKCNLREAVPGGNLCEQDSKLSGGTTYVFDNRNQEQIEESGNQSAPEEHEGNGGSDREA